MARSVAAKGKRIARCRAGECPEWQRELTVNQPSYDFVGSSPTSPTILLRAKALRRIERCPTAKQDALRSLGEGGPVPVWYVYLLESETFDGQRYVGMTSDVDRRLLDHNAGKSSHTSKYMPWRLVTYIASPIGRRRKHSNDT